MKPRLLRPLARDTSDLSFETERKTDENSPKKSKVSKEDDAVTPKPKAQARDDSHEADIDEHDDSQSFFKEEDMIAVV